jgi:antitoxin component HigA of HigAB toxin-antitoxin module
MNTENFKPLKNLTLDFIQEKQMEIMFKYEPSEKEVFENFDIDVYEDQETFKKYCWRITEEITEALEDMEHPQHFKEEITDAFNFLLELYSLYGWKVSDLGTIFSEGYDDPPEFVGKITKELSLDVITSIGLTANLLKNRKWRQSQYLVDLYIFEKRFKDIWNRFEYLVYWSGISKEELFDQWSLKYQVNEFRINTKY